MTGHADGFQRTEDQDADVGSELHHDVGIDMQSGFRHNRDVGTYHVRQRSRVQRETLGDTTAQIVQVDLSIYVPGRGNGGVERVARQVRPIIGHGVIVPVVEVEDPSSAKETRVKPRRSSKNRFLELRK